MMIQILYFKVYQKFLFPMKYYLNYELLIYKKILLLLIFPTYNNERVQFYFILRL